MQTFLPYPDIEQSALILDPKLKGLKHSGRAFKQVVEASQLVDIVIKKQFGLPAAWSWHPAYYLWKNNLDALCLYFNIFYRVVCIERKAAKPIKMATKFPITHVPDIEYGLRRIDPNPIMPPWFGREDFHAAHRSKLLEKLPEYYCQFNWHEFPGMEYKWS